MKFAVALFASLVLASIVAASEPFNCSAVVDDNSRRRSYFYNLTSLFHSSQYSDNLYYQGTGGELTYINLCGPTTTTCSPASPVCKRSGLWSTMGYGQLTTQEIVLIEKDGVDADKGVTVKYTGGEFCPGAGATSAVIHIVCGTDDIVTDVSINSDGCSLTATISSQAGCGIEVDYPGTSSGEVFAIVVLVLLLVGVILYIGIGMLVNWKVKGVETVPDMIPHREFWMSIPMLVVDGCKFIGHGCKKGDYVNL